MGHKSRRFITNMAPKKKILTLPSKFKKIEKNEIGTIFGKKEKKQNHEGAKQATVTTQNCDS